VHHEARKPPELEPRPPEGPVGPYGSVSLSPERPEVLVMTGEVDVAVSDDALAELPGWTGVRVVDLSAVTFLDSSGMRLVAQVARLVRPHRLQVVGARKQPLTALRLFGADRITDLVED